MNTIDKLHGARMRCGIFTLMLGGAALAAGCGDDATGTGGAGGAGGAGTTSSSSQTTHSTSTTTTQVGPGGAGGAGSGTGGEGGEGGAGSGSGGEGGAGSGSGGEGGGAPSLCFDVADYADLFTLDTDRLCVVGRYDAPGWFTSSYGVQPTWGLHGGPLTGEYFSDNKGGSITDVELTRWTAPDGTTGALTSDTSAIAITLLGDDADFGGAQFVDLAEGFTAFNYTGADFFSEGGLVVVDDTTDLEVDHLIGAFGIGVDAEGFPMHTSLGLLFEEAGPAGLYGTVLCDEGGLLCGSFPYAQWGDSTGPLVVDADGNTFAVMTSFDGTQSARGFGAGEIAAAEGTEGVDLFTVGGFGSPLAALAPADDAPGLLVFQATDGDTFVPVPAILSTYGVSGDAVLADGQPEPFLTPTAADAAVSLMTDEEGRIWVGVGTDDGTTFAVLARP